MTTILSPLHVPLHLTHRSPLSWWRFRVRGLMSGSLLMTSQFCMIFRDEIPIFSRPIERHQLILCSISMRQERIIWYFVFRECQCSCLVSELFTLAMTICRFDSDMILCMCSIKGVVSTFFTFWPLSLPHDLFCTQCSLWSLMGTTHPWAWAYLVLRPGLQIRRQPWSA